MIAIRTIQVVKKRVETMLGDGVRWVNSGVCIESEHSQLEGPLRSTACGNSLAVAAHP